MTHTLTKGNKLTTSPHARSFAFATAKRPTTDPGASGASPSQQQMDQNEKRAVPVPPAGAVPSAGQPRTHPTIVSQGHPTGGDPSMCTHHHAACYPRRPGPFPYAFDADPMPRTALSIGRNCLNTL